MKLLVDDIGLIDGGGLTIISDQHKVMQIDIEVQLVFKVQCLNRHCIKSTGGTDKTNTYHVGRDKNVCYGKVLQNVEQTRDMEGGCLPCYFKKAQTPVC